MTATEGTTATAPKLSTSVQPAKAEESSSFVRPSLQSEIVRQVVRQKLRKQRHLVLPKAVASDYLDELFPKLLELFNPQTVYYNGGVAKVPEWKISCYLEVMDGGVPTTEPNLALKDHFQPLLDACNKIFLFWYRQQHACNKVGQKPVQGCYRLMTFVTRYTPNPGEQALLKVSKSVSQHLVEQYCLSFDIKQREAVPLDLAMQQTGFMEYASCFFAHMVFVSLGQHVDGAGKVDGSIVVALPIDRWSAPESENAFEGGGLTFWDGGNEIHYDTRSGDLALIDR